MIFALLILKFAPFYVLLEKYVLMVIDVLILALYVVDLHVLLEEFVLITIANIMHIILDL